MKINRETNIQHSISISETDMVNGGEALILTAYISKEGSGVYTYLAPQIFNEEVYNRNKDIYDAQVAKFREEFQLEEMPTALSRIDKLNESNSELYETGNATMIAVDELLELVSSLSSRVDELETGRA